MTSLRIALLALLLALGGCLTWVEPGVDDDDSGDDDDATADDDDATGDDDDSTPDPDDLDGDGWTPADGDCDDEDPDVNPEAAEACNGIGDDCDSEIDEELPTEMYAPDTDGDGVHTANQSLWVEACAQPEGHLPLDSSTTDCADNDPNVFPGANEVCNGIDDDCDGSLDEDVQVSLYLDGDGDGWGVGAPLGLGCPGVGFATMAGDCDDGSAELNMDDADGDGITSCDGDCDDTLFGVQPGSDYDGDGFTACLDDCDDSDPNINPQTSEVCNGEDDNCNGAVDEGLTSIVVIHGADTANADAIDTLLGDAGYCMSPLIDIGDLWNIPSLPQAAVIATYDIGDTSGVWGDWSPVWNWYQAGDPTLNLPGALIAMGTGGMSGLDWLGQSTELSWSNASLTQGDAFYVRMNGALVFSYPNNLNVAGGSVITLTGDPGAQNVLLNTWASTSTLYAWGDQVGGSASFVASTNTSAGGSFNRHLYLWGNSGSMAQATSDGEQLLENVIRAAIGPP